MNLASRFFPADPAERHELRWRIFRLLAASNLILGFYYIWYRYTETINFSALWFSIPLLIAETYSFIDTCLFAFNLWQPKRRVTPPCPAGKTVDVFIPTYSEPIDLVIQTAEATMRIRYPHKTWVLDDGSRAELKARCEKIGCGYITRGPEWANKPRHAKAGNVNNALLKTSGEFILILDADQIPTREIIERMLGYFDEPQVAFVQSPQYFYNVPPDDPFGSDAPLFYGPIQQGKDGWNAAFFCGSNAILRRDALFQLGLVTYVQQTEADVRTALRRAEREASARAQKFPKHKAVAARKVAVAAQEAVKKLAANEYFQEVVNQFNLITNEAKREITEHDLDEIAKELVELENLISGEEQQTVREVRQAIAYGFHSLANELAIIAPPSDAIGLSAETIEQLTLQRTDDATEISPLTTISITEDMATAMRLHALGWKSVFHPEILAYGLAPEDLGSALSQRLRWAQGTIQVMLRDNPLTKPGLELPQRVQYFTTMYSYFSGFFSLMYLSAPIIYLLTGIPPVSAWTGDFLLRVFAFFIVNKIMFRYAAAGIDVTRGEQYSLALFPLWIQAVVSVFSGIKLDFKVTPKERQSGVFLNLVMPQLIIIMITLFASLFGLLSLLMGWSNQWQGILINVFWGGYNILLLSVIVRAAVWRPPKDWETKPPAFLLSKHPSSSQL